MKYQFYIVVFLKRFMSDLLPYERLLIHFSTKKSAVF